MRAQTFDEFYSPNLWMPITAAVAFHALMFVINPTVLKRGLNDLPPLPTMEIKMLDKMPVLTPPVPKVIPKPIPKKAPPKKKGLAAKPKPAPVKHVAKLLPPKPVFRSKIEIPKLIPTASDDIIAATPSPKLVQAARVTQSAIPAPTLLKSRGIKISEVNIKLTERSALSTPSAVAVIPVGDQRDDIATVAPAQAILTSKKGVRSMVSSNPTLANKNHEGFYSGVQTSAHIDRGDLSGAESTGKTVTGKGFEIGGPIGDRKIISRKLPEYPAWAEEKGITAAVQIYFTVKPDGSIRPSMRVQRSSGYSELDDLAKKALLNWRFSPASVSDESVAWGVITFRFTLN